MKKARNYNAFLKNYKRGAIILKIGLVACCSKKLNTEYEAKDMYISTLFKYSMKYLNERCDKIFILSAEYGLLELNEKIVYYDKTLNKMNKTERISWSSDVLKELKLKTNLENDQFIILAGKRYREELVKHMKNYDIPMEKLGIGKQLKFLKEANHN